MKKNHVFRVFRKRNRRLLFAALAALIVAASAVAPALSGEPIWKNIGEKQLVKLLEGGRVAFVDRGQRPGKELAVAGVMIKASPDKVWATLTDYESYPEMVDQITKVKVIESTDKYAIVQFYMFLIKLGPLKIQANYIQKWNYEKPKRIVITGVEEKDGKWVKVKDAAANATMWDLVPADGGKRTMLFHTTVSDLRASGMVGAYMVDRQPTIQIGFDLANALTQDAAVKKRIEEGK